MVFVLYFCNVKTQNHTTMKRILFLMMAFVAVIGFTGCPNPEAETIDLGTIPEQYLATVPYQDGEVFYLQHESDRVNIPFKVTRYRVKALGDNVYGFDDQYPGYKMKPSPSTYFNYEIDITTCKPDYPLFDIDIRFSNAYLADSLYYPNYDPMSPKYAMLHCHNLYASIPFIGESTSMFTVHDSFKVHDDTYYNVFEFVNENQDLQGIYPKSLFYTYKEGVIEIDMSNGEKYLRYEEE